MTKNWKKISSQRRTLTGEYDQKFMLYVACCTIWFLVIFNPLIFVVVVIFMIFSIFGHIHRLRFVVVNFQSCSNSESSSVSVIFKPIFGHLYSVKLSSLIFPVTLTTFFFLSFFLSSFLSFFLSCFLHFFAGTSNFFSGNFLLRGSFLSLLCLN